MSKDFKMKGIESKDGVVKLYDERVVLFPPNIISLLGSVFGQGSKPLLVYLGKKMGRKLAETWEEHIRPKNLRELSEIFLGMTANAGWGTFTIEEVNDDKIIVRLHHNIAKTEEQKSKHICDFIAGYLTGFGEFSMFNAQVIESKCSIEDSTIDFCEFVISKRKV